MATEVITGELSLDKTKFGVAEVIVGKLNQRVDGIAVQTDAEHCVVRISCARKKQSIGEEMINRLSGQDNFDLVFSEIILHQNEEYTLGGHRTNDFPSFIRCPIIIGAKLGAMGEPGTLKYTVSLVNIRRF